MFTCAARDFLRSLLSLKLGRGGAVKGRGGAAPGIGVIGLEPSCSNWFNQNAPIVVFLRFSRIFSVKLQGCGAPVYNILCARDLRTGNTMVVSTTSSMTRVF